MNVICAICQDLLESSNDIFITPCGHVFHFPCLIQWLEKSPSCPQCRQKVQQNNIKRIYFNVSNTEAIKEDSCSLQQKIDSLSFKLKLQQKEFSTLREDHAKLKKQNTGLREEVKKTESDISQKNAVIHALKEQSLYFKQKAQDYDKVREEKQLLEKKLETYENVKTLICATSEDVEKMLIKTTDVSALTTYIAVMKRELDNGLHKRKELRNMVKRIQHELQTMKMERFSFADEYTNRIEQLEEELAMCRSEKEALQNKLDEVQINGERSESVEAASKPESENIKSRKRETNIDIDFDMDLDELSPKKMKRSEKVKLTSSKDKDDSVIFVSPFVKKTKENEENSPYLPTKSKSIFGGNRKMSQRGGLSLNSKRTLLSSTKSDSALKSSRKDPTATFDGFGGHSKIETFPLPKSSPNKLKRSASDMSKSKKIKLDLGGNKQLDDYIINLT